MTPKATPKARKARLTPSRAGAELTLAGKRPLSVAAGAGFGLMLASKYLPHLFGLYALYNVSVGWKAGDQDVRLGLFRKPDDAA